MKNIRKTRLAAAVATALGAGLLVHDAGAVNLATDGIGEVAIAPYYTTRDGWQTLVNLTNTTQHPVVVKLRVHEAWNSRDVFDITILLSSFDSFTALLTESNGAPVFRVVDTDTCTAPLGTTQANPGDALAQREWPLSTYAFGGTGADNERDGGPTDVDRLREGYVEFLVQGHYTNDGGPYDVVNLNNNEDGDANNVRDDDSPGELIEAHYCQDLDAIFGTRHGNNGRNALWAAQFAGEPINALKYNYRLINVGRGIEAGGAATAWSNFFNADASGNIVAGLSVSDGTIRSGDGPDNDYGIFQDPNIADVSDNAGGPAALAECVITRGEERANNQGNPSHIEWNPDDRTAVNAASGQGSCLNLITAQIPYDFLEPTLNDAFPVRANGWADRQNLELEAANPLVPALVAEGRVGNNGIYPDALPRAGVARSIRGIDAVSVTIQRSAVINEWAESVDLGAGTGVATDWIVNFPTKTFYVDQDPGTRNQVIAHPNIDNGQTGEVSYQAGIVREDRDEAFYTFLNPGIWEVDGAEMVNAPYPPFREEFVGVDTDNEIVTNNDGSCVGVEYNVYDRRENTLSVTGGSVPSPAPTIPGEDICFETNVLTFNGASVLASQVATDVDTGALENNGWLHLSFTDNEADASGNTIQAGSASGLVGWDGLPTTGFVVKQRNVGSTSANYASSMDHGYRRTCDENRAWCPEQLEIDPN